MNIVISQRIIRNRNGDLADSLEQNYIKYYQSFGVTLIPIPNALKNISDFFKSLKIERIILSGGGDVDLKLFSNRDEIETKIMNIAKGNNIPVLGICRGMQFLNIFFGGSLIKDLKKTFPNSQNHVAVNHQIEIVDPEIKKIFSSNMLYVNSYHNSGLREKELSVKLKVFARSKDNLIEGIYHPKLPIAGIMWHPERQSPNKNFNNKLVKAFLKRELCWKA